MAMKTLSVGAFEAKTHLSQPLDEVENGAIVKISRRGKPLAVLKQDEAMASKAAISALSDLRRRCQPKVTVREVIEYLEEGRER